MGFFFFKQEIHTEKKIKKLIYTLFVSVIIWYDFVLDQLQLSPNEPLDS